jgi:hypothetical protein
MDRSTKSRTAPLALALGMALGANLVCGGELPPGTSLARFPFDTQTPRYELGAIGHIVPGFGWKLIHVAPGSPATLVMTERFGRVSLEVDDVIVCINGHAIHSEADYIAAMNASSGEVTIVVHDRRGSGFVTGCAKLVSVAE